MFKTIVEDLKKQEASCKRERDQAQKAATAASEELVSSLVETVDQGASQAFAIQRDIGKEAKEVRTLLAKADRQAGRWAASVDRVNKAMKEFGDIETFLQVVDKEIRSLTASLAKLRQPSFTDSVPLESRRRS